MTKLIITRNTETLTVFTALVCNKDFADFSPDERKEYQAARIALNAEKQGLTEMIQSKERAAAMGRAYAKAIA